MMLRILLCLMLLPLSALAQGSSTNAIMLDPGLASTPNAYNPGTQKAINGRRISPQIWYEAHTSSCTLNSTCGSTNDSGKLLTATAANVIFTAPSPGAVGAASFMFGYDNAHPYILATVSGTIYGCGTTGTSVTLAVQAQLISDGTNWQCVQGGIGVSVLPNNTLLGQNSGGGGQQALTASQVTTMLAGTSGSVFGTLSANKTDSGDNAWTNRARTPPCALTDAGTIAVSAAGCNVRTVTLGGNRTLGDPTSALGGEWLTFLITQDGTGSRTLSFGPSYTFPGGTAPTLSTAAGAKDILSCYISSISPLETDCPGFTANVTRTTTPVLLAHNTGKNAGAGNSVIVSLTGYAGNPLLIGTFLCSNVNCTAGTDTITSITTSSGNSCSEVASAKNAGVLTTDIWTCGTGTSGTNTVTINCTTGCNYLYGSVSEWSGISGSCVGGASADTSGTSISATTSAPSSVVNSVIFSMGLAGAGAAVSVGSGLTAISADNETEYQIGRTLQTYTNSYTTASTGQLDMSVAACH